MVVTYQPVLLLLSFSSSPCWITNTSIEVKRPHVIDPLVVFAPRCWWNRNSSVWGGQSTDWLIARLGEAGSSWGSASVASPSPLPGDYCIHSDYHFAFEIPPGWSPKEQDPPASSSQSPPQALVLGKADCQTIFEFKSVFGGTRIGLSGLPAGELVMQPDGLVAFGRLTSAYRLTYQGNVKLVFYDLQFEVLRGSVMLQRAPGVKPEDYDAIHLPEAIQAELAAMLQSLTRTGPRNLPSALASIVEFRSSC